MKHDKYAKGFRSMDRLRAHPIIAARDYYYSYVIYQEELKVARGAGYFRRLADCFTVPRIRRANYGASTVMIAQQMCGINSRSRISALRLQEPRLIPSHSHLLLQLHDLFKCGLHANPGIIRLARIRCRASDIDDPYAIPHRHQGPQNAYADNVPRHVYIPLSGRSITLESLRQHRWSDCSSCSVRLPLHHLLLPRRRTGSVPILCRGLPNYST